MVILTENVYAVGLILHCDHRYSHYPWEATVEFNFTGVVFEMAECCHEGIFDGIERVEETVGEPFFTDFVPEVFHRIAFRAVGRQPDEADIWRYRQSLSDMPSGPIHDQDDVFVGVATADLAEEITHERCTDLGKNQRDHGTVVGGDRRINKGVFTNQLTGNHRTTTLGSPAATGNSDTPETRFILEHQAQRASRLGKAVSCLPHDLREFFLKRRWASASTCGCRGRGATLRQP
jgi:hypothetical protein